MKNTQITHLAHYVPVNKVHNKDLEAKYQQRPHSIFTRTGIRERRYAKRLSSTDMAVAAIERLFEKTSVKRLDIDLVLVGSLTPTYFFPSAATQIIEACSLDNAYGFDLSSACPSWLLALDMANSYLCLGRAKKALVIGVDKMSATLNAFDYKTGVLFGDAAAVAVIEHSDQSGIIDCVHRVVSGVTDVFFKTPLGSDDWVQEKFELDGQKVYKQGVTLTVDLIRCYLNTHQRSLADYDYIIPHQANIRMINSIADMIECSRSKFLTNLEYFGNTASASIPLVLSQKYEAGVIKKGQRLLLISFGAGYSLSLIDLVL